MLGGNKKKTKSVVHKVTMPMVDREFTLTQRERSIDERNKSSTMTDVVSAIKLPTYLCQSKDSEE